MRKLLLVADDPLHQCAFYRLWPFLSKSFRYSGEETWTYSMSTDRVRPEDILSSEGVFVLRPYNEAHVSILRMAKQMGKATWVDYDDDFLNMGPHQNGAEDMMSVAAFKRFEAIGRLADMVTVSTPKLEDVYSSIAAARPVTVPNAFNDDLYCLPAASNADSKIIVWRGAHGHVFEMQTITDLVDSWAGYKFVFIGSVHRDLPKKLPKVTFYPFMPMADYFVTLKALRPRAVLVPLANTPFNDAKSNCAWIEATHAGAVTIASPCAEFYRPGITLARNVEDWDRAVDVALMYSVVNWGKSAENIPIMTQVNSLRRTIWGSLF